MVVTCVQVETTFSDPPPLVKVRMDRGSGEKCMSLILFFGICA
jgi:hypothetical protein